MSTKLIVLKQFYNNTDNIILYKIIGTDAITYYNE
jgi:hypothetical protein